MIEFSEIEISYSILPFIGLMVGIFGTVLGGGGGFLFLPILTLLTGVPAQTAVFTSLVATLPICIVGSLGHYHKGNIDFKTGLKFALAGIIGAFVGAGITSMISTGLLKISFVIYSVVIALSIVLTTRQKRRAKSKGTEWQAFTVLAKDTRSAFFGFLAGTITGTFGTSGTAPVLAGLFSLHLPLKLVIGTSLMVVLSNTIFAIGAHFLVGKIDLTLVYFLTAGSVIGALIGPKILSKMKIEKYENIVRYLYAIVMVALGVLMIVR